MELAEILLIVFFSVEFVFGIVDGILLYKAKTTKDEAKTIKINTISNIIFFGMIAVSIAGCVLLQIYGSRWWAIFPLFFTGLLTVYVVYGIIRGIANAGVKKE